MEESPDELELQGEVPRPSNASSSLHEPRLQPKPKRRPIRGRPAEATQASAPVSTPVPDTGPPRESHLAGRRRLPATFSLPAYGLRISTHRSRRRSRPILLPIPTCARQKTGSTGGVSLPLAEMALCCSGTPWWPTSHLAHWRNGTYAEAAMEQALEAHLSVVPCCLASLARRRAASCGYILLARECVQTCLSP